MVRSIDHAAAPQTSMFVQDMRRKYGGEDAHDPILFTPILELKDPVHITDEPGDRVYSLHTLLTLDRNPCTRAPLDPRNFEPLVAANLVKRDFLDTIRVLVDAGWTHIEGVQADMAQLPKGRLTDVHLRRSHWPEVWRAYQIALGDRAIEPGLTLPQRIFRMHGFERMEAIRTLILIPLRDRAVANFRARRDVQLLRFYDERNLSLQSLYNADLLGAQHHRAHTQERLARNRRHEPDHDITVDDLATILVVLRWRLYQQHTNVLIRCQDMVDDFQYVADRFASTTAYSTNRARLEALLDARMVKAYNFATEGWTHYLMHPMTPEQVILYGLGYLDPDSLEGMRYNPKAWVSKALDALETERQIYPAYSLDCLQRALPDVQANGEKVFKADANGKLLYTGGVSRTPEQRVFLEELDAHEMDELNLASNAATMYGQIVQHCDELNGP